MIDSVFWTVDDALAGTCSMADVGSRKPEAAAIVVDAIDEGDMTASERLKRDALTAYKALGGPEYLRRNPELLDKALLKMIAEPDKKVDAQVTIKIDAPWMSPDRLSYLRQEVIDMTPSGGHVPESWKAENSATLPVVKASDMVPMPDPRTVANPSAPGATPKRTG